MRQHGNYIIVEGVQDLIDYCKEKNVRIGTSPEGLTTTKRFEIEGEDFDLIRLATGPSEAAPYKVVRHRICAKPQVLEEINQEFIKELSAHSGEPIRSDQLRNLTDEKIERSFVYLDISDFSQFSQDDQANTIRSLVMLVENDHNWVNRVTWDDLRTNMEAKLCIGDGYIYVFVDPVVAAWFAAHLANLIERVSAMGGFSKPFHFRASVHAGEVDRFYDPGRQGWNYVGDGINGGSRVLDAIGKDRDDVVYVSGELRADIFNYVLDATTDALIDSFSNMGRVKDKHGRPWRVFYLDHIKAIDSSDYLFLRKPPISQ